MTLDEFTTSPEACPACDGLADGDLCFDHHLESEGAA